MDGWMTRDFISFSTVFQSYQDDGWMIMKGCVQWSLVYGWEDFASSRARTWNARSVGQHVLGLTQWATWAPSFKGLGLINKRPKRPWIAHLSIQAKIQTFNFEIWVTFDQGQRMTLIIDTHSTSLTHWVEWFKQLWDRRLQKFPKK